MTKVRLAYVGGSGEYRALSGTDNPPPHLLVSYYHFNPFEKGRTKDPPIRYLDWVLDSGAYSAYHQNKTIDLKQYIKDCHRLLESKDPPQEIFGLDVIGDPVKTVEQLEVMWAEGIEAIPTYHYGEPETYLFNYAEQYPKIALGGAVGVPVRQKTEWARQCFARVWPKKIHGFGFGSEQSLMALPFHSADSSNWAYAANITGTWKTYGRMSTDSKKRNLAPEVAFFIDLENRLKAKWGKALEELK